MAVEVETPALLRLRDIVPNAIRTTDLSSAYEFSHPLNFRRWGTAMIDHRNGAVVWRIEFAEEDGQNVLEFGKPLTRKIEPGRLAIGRAAGVVAYHALFYVRGPFRGLGFAPAVLAAESELYARWGVAQIQILAADEGAAYWVRKHGFRPQSWEHLRERLPGWLARKKLPPVAPATPADLPWDYLVEASPLVVYKDLE